MTDLTDPPSRRDPSKHVVNFGGARYAGNQDMLRKMAEEMMAAGEKVLWASPHAPPAPRPAPNPAVVDLAEVRAYWGKVRRELAAVHWPAANADWLRKMREEAK